MRNFLLIVLIALGGYWYAHRNHGLDHADDLTGAWSQVFLRESTPCRMTLHLEADGHGSLRVNYVQQGQHLSRDVSGQWQCGLGQFSFTFSPGVAPDFIEPKRFTGRIITIDDRQLQFKSPTGIESWSRGQ